MQADRPHPLAGPALVLAGASVALWTLVHPCCTFAGAELGLSGRWFASHTFHFLGGMFGLIGLLGLVERESRQGKRFERAAFGIAFVGTALFASTGVITAFLWPTLAAHAPAVTELDGPIFSPPHPVIGISAVTYSVGHLLLAVALKRAGAITMAPAAVLVAGSLLLLFPPQPLGFLPWIAFPVGGALFGVGLGMVGLALRGGLGSAVVATAPAG